MFSTLTARRTSARRRASRWTPTPRKSAKTTGNSSGSAATASVAAEISASNQPKPWRSRTPASTTQSSRAATSRVRVRPAIEIWSGVRARVVCAAERRISPYQVSAPVTATRSLAFPVSSRVPAKPQCRASMGAPVGRGGRKRPLAHRVGLAREGRLVGLHLVARQQEPIGRERLAGRHRHQVARHDQLRGDLLLDAVADDPRARRETSAEPLGRRTRAPVEVLRPFRPAGRSRRAGSAPRLARRAPRRERRSRRGTTAWGPSPSRGSARARGAAAPRSPGSRRSEPGAPPLRSRVSPRAGSRRSSMRSGGSERRMPPAA